MKRFLLLLFVALFTVAILLFLYNPEILEKIWLWIVGLIGLITASVRSVVEWLKKIFDKENSKETVEKSSLINNQNLPDQITQSENQLKKNLATDSFKGITLNLIRYKDDGNATLGLLFYNQSFFCYTLEDTFHPIKKPGVTRIPQGNYSLAFNTTVSPLTLKYREQFPWFTFHLELKNVPDYSSVYLYVGNYHEDTEGCILIADGIGANNNESMVTYSRQAYKRLYQKLTSEIQQGTPARIIVRDESWLSEKIQTQSQTLMPTL